MVYFVVTKKLHARVNNNKIQRKILRNAVIVVVIVAFLKIGETLVQVHQHHVLFNDVFKY